MKKLVLCIEIALLCVTSVFAQSKRTKQSGTTKPKTGIRSEAKGRGCAVTVRDDLLPNRTVVVVGCDWFGISETGRSKDGLVLGFRPTTGGIVVFDDELNLIFKWTACSACGGFFSHFAGTKKFRGHNALMVKLVNGPSLDAGESAEPTEPLYFNGKEFKFAEIPR